MDLSCFPFSMDLFDLNKVYFSDCPTKLCSLDGLKTKIKLFTGALVLNYATTEKLLADMNNNGIRKAVIHQINPPDKNSADIMEEIVNKNERLYTLGSVHPFDKDIDSKIKHYMNYYQNVYTDISIQPAEHIKTLIRAIGSERILFGTDYPFVTQAFSILSVLRATQNEDERTYIFSKNAKRLLGDSVMEYHGCEFEKIEKDVYRYYYTTKKMHSAWVTIKRTGTDQWYYIRLDDVSVSEEFQSLQECIDNAYEDMLRSKL